MVAAGAGLLIMVAVHSAHIVAQTALSIIAAIATMALAGISPLGAIAATAATIGFVSRPVPFGSAYLSAPEMLVLGSFVGVAARVVLLAVRSRSWSLTSLRWSQLTPSRFWSGFTLPAAVLVLAGLISLLTLARPEYRSESLREFRWVVIEPVLFYLMMRLWVRSGIERWLVAGFFLIGAAIVGLTGIADLVLGSGLSVEGVVRVSGVYPHPNALALYLERAVVFGAGLAALYRRDVGMIWVAAIAPAALALILTFSRGAILAAGLSLVIALAVSRRRNLTLATAAALVVGFMILALLAQDRMAAALSTGSGSLRLVIWASAIEMIRDYPLTGVGLDQFLYSYAPRYIDPVAWPERFTSHPHNIVLDIWLRVGIMGLIAASLYGVVFVRRIRQVIRSRSRLGLAAGAAVVAGLLHGLVDNGYFLPDLALAFWFFSSLVDAEAVDRAGSDAPES